MNTWEPLAPMGQEQIDPQETGMGMEMTTGTLIALAIAGYFIFKKKKKKEYEEEEEETEEEDEESITIGTVKLRDESKPKENYTITYHSDDEDD